MKFLIVLSVCLAGAYASSYNAGYNAPAEIRVSSYEAPATRMSSYSAPSYTAQSYAAPVEVRKAIVPIVNYNMDNDHYGTFKLDHTSGDGTIVSNVGSLRNLGDKEGPVNVQTGSYSYLGDDKVQYTINWSADENGFVASGAHLPTPPPVPQEIQESLRLQTSAPSTYSNYESNYESPAPVVRVTPVSYSAPVRAAQQVYEAPAIRVVSSGY